MMRFKAAIDFRFALQLFQTIPETNGQTGEVSGA
ncbi:Uncharacterised protein [Vibrio cholerae]|nr:Uncharacterised protein [Vibrio cholerae]